MILPAALSLLAALGMQGLGAPAKPLEEREPAAVVHAIAPDLAIVTEVGTLSPYVGQQFSVIYWLRARRAPAAVDVDPQQFPGFWTEMVPLSPESGPVVRTAERYSDYLLRQVVAFPLLEGAAQLPPLSVKIRLAAARPAASPDWDVVARSESLPLQVRALPARAGLAGAAPLVGEVRGSISAQAGGAGRGAILEVEGTANLGLFRPEEWLAPAPGVRLRCRLLASDRMTQILDTGGRRRLTLRARQRWLLECDADATGDLRLEVFEPRTASWSEVRIAGALLPPARPRAAAASGGFAVAAAAPETGTRLTLPALAAAAALALAAVLRRARRRVRTGGRSAVDFAALERKMRQSPHAFLDDVRRAIDEHARRRMRRHDLGERDTLLDECWRSVERYRFAGEAPPLEARVELLQRLRFAMQSPDSVMAGSDENMRD